MGRLRVGQMTQMLADLGDSKRHFVVKLMRKIVNERKHQNIEPYALRAITTVIILIDSLNTITRTVKIVKAKLTYKKFRLGCSKNARMKKYYI